MSRVAASPYARRLARERGLDLGGLSGSGPGGRVIARDLDGVTSYGSAAATTPKDAAKHATLRAVARGGPAGPEEALEKALSEAGTEVDVGLVVLSHDGLVGADIPPTSGQAACLAAVRRADDSLALTLTFDRAKLPLAEAAAMLSGIVERLDRAPDQCGSSS